MGFWNGTQTLPRGFSPGELPGPVPPRHRTRVHGPCLSVPARRHTQAPGKAAALIPRELVNAPQKVPPLTHLRICEDLVTELAVTVAGGIRNNAEDPFTVSSIRGHFPRFQRKTHPRILKLEEWSSLFRGFLTGVPAGSFMKSLELYIGFCEVS